MSPAPQSGDELLFGAAAVMEPAAAAPLTRSARRRLKEAKAERRANAADDDLADDRETLKSGWIAMGFSLAVHAFLLAVLAVLVVQGASIRSDETVIIDGNLGGGGGNAGLGDPVSLSLEPLLPAAGENASSAMATVDSVAMAATRGHPFGTPGGAQETGLGGGRGDGFGGGEGDGFLRLPRGAVTAGSFAAWTVPQGIDNNGRRIRERDGKPGEPGESPLEGEVYFIVIRIKLPANRSTYSLSDLSGSVIGTDKYRQIIPEGVFVLAKDGRLEKPSRTGKLDVKNRSIDIVMRVPGAEGLVKDTIELKSKLLNETQRMTLEFAK
ncbi:hypothetical protein Pan44_49190 [Caulifigura coniformis]|uniref:Uncharacterized protein n=1 Tax=Caulifigura coniformis TaxID=2527983 RepID=A0A517SL52_9PLAN|nr:hypothetical protein [Caulifigura coniformis]QDT56859.1 hypothetical protein Pan44_49190 [Caulifigura coniformis]